MRANPNETLPSLSREASVRAGDTVTVFVPSPSDSLIDEIYGALRRLLDPGFLSSLPVVVGGSAAVLFARAERTVSGALFSDELAQLAGGITWTSGPLREAKRLQQPERVG